MDLAQGVRDGLPVTQQKIVALRGTHGAFGEVSGVYAVDLIFPQGSQLMIAVMPNKAEFRQ